MEDPRRSPLKRRTHAMIDNDERPNIDRMASTGSSSRGEQEIAAQLMEAGALDRGEEEPAPEPSLPPVPLPVLDAGEQALQDTEGPPAPSDSVNQLKNMMGQQPRPKIQQYSYRHDDSDTTKTELDEFFSYVEVPGVVAEGKEAWGKGWSSRHPDWPDAPKDLRRAFIRQQLEQLEHRDNDKRFEAARRLAYIAQGTPSYCRCSSDYLLMLVIANCGLLREAGALQSVYEALKNAGGRWSSLASMPETDLLGHSWPNQQERQEYLEEINGELAILLCILYFVVEIHRGDESWADELMALDPPLPFYLISVIASLRERNAKGYPVKKLLLLLWKSLLATLGGMRDLNRVKTLVRSIEGLPEDPTLSRHRMVTKVSPVDFQTFRQEITSKYPSYLPPTMHTPIPILGIDRIAASAAPTPLRPLYPYTQPQAMVSGTQANEQQQVAQQGAPQPATPAPTPPPSPKPKKQQYQTDQSRPFVLPFSRVTSGATIPHSIDEASLLYKQHVRLSTDLWQTTKVREECLSDESGIAYAQDNARVNGHEENAYEATLPDSLQMLQAMRTLNEAQARDATDAAAQSALEQRVSDLKRLERTELLYRTALVNLQPTVVVLLKLLLATVTASNGLAALPSVSDEEPAPPVLNLEDTDIMRHREITSKAVSAILIMLLKWFKTSHVMKFQYLAQLIVDSNGLLLILKMFGAQEVSTLVRMRNEVDESNFFHFCAQYGSDAAANGSSETMLSIMPLPAQAPHTNGTAEDAEVELVTDFAWRNFFATINFVHILQKLTKRKVHRILLLTQYKAQAVLKRMLKVTQPYLQLYLLKLIKSQVPFSGRKWRQSNMKVITSIYLNCRPDLRDEWLTGMDVDSDIEDSLPHEQALRGLIRFYNSKHYHNFAPHLIRHPSQSVFAVSPAVSSVSDGPSLMPQASPSLHAEESFPPARPAGHYTRDIHLRTTAYGADSEGYLEDYEEILGDLLTPRYLVDQNGVPSLYPDDGAASSDSVWQKLGEMLGESDDISDSESIASIGFLGFGDTDVPESVTAEDSESEGRPQWAQMSPKIITALEEERAMQEVALGSPRSPRPRRASSGPKSPALRPVMPMFDNDDQHEEAIEFEDERGPIQSAPHAGPAVDEVEAVFHV